MTPATQEPTVLVRMPVHLVAAILKMRDSLDRDLMASLAASIAGDANVKTKETGTLPTPLNEPRHHKYKAEYLGVSIGGRTLPDVFAAIVDLTAEIAPEALERLADMRARSRRYVARNPEAIHPGNKELPTKRTTSGWWISKNIGQEDLMRALKALCDASGLRFGPDVRFIVQS
ncbi:hypothetical protein M4578_11415 [Salipiger sp. P9]|uniref:hypothetical protein n=1 Tax=Salipiger pentaromativorans TaxID=2943193 RepID=UPI0021573B8F|nr:hypothetical protein [Salipiger pentaromativorans]MCR8548442.1 hypothetical protein [Salipiger pentaromativorans]